MSVLYFSLNNNEFTADPNSVQPDSGVVKGFGVKTSRLDGEARDVNVQFNILAG